MDADQGSERAAEALPCGADLGIAQNGDGVDRHPQSREKADDFCSHYSSFLGRTAGWTV